MHLDEKKVLFFGVIELSIVWGELKPLTFF